MAYPSSMRYSKLSAFLPKLELLVSPDSNYLKIIIIIIFCYLKKEVRNLTVVLCLHAVSLKTKISTLLFSGGSEKNLWHPHISQYNKTIGKVLLVWEIWISWSRKGCCDPGKGESLNNCCSHLKQTQPFPFWEGLEVTGLAKFSQMQPQALENGSPELFAIMGFVIRKLKETWLFFPT